MTEPPRNDRVCIVTGASRGIGAATARMLGKSGYPVAVNYMRNGKAADDVVADIKSHGGKAVAIQADIGDAADVARLFETTAAELGTPYAVINNAAEPGSRQPIDQINMAMVRRVLAVNLEGTILCSAQAARCMGTDKGGKGGVIVNISSQVVRTGGYRLVPYVASKAGIEAITPALARELGPAGIRVNTLCLGLVATEAVPLVDQHGKPRSAEVPLGRMAGVDEIAQVVLWLLSDGASYVSGAIIPVTGGR